MSNHRVKPERGWSSGKRLASCRWCGGALPTNRRSFCSGESTRGELFAPPPGYAGPLVHGRWGRRTIMGTGCVHEWQLRSSAGYLRRSVEARDAGVCAACGIDTVAAEAWILAEPAAALAASAALGLTLRRMRTRFASWQADHIVPVVEGGGECGLDGMRTLCGGCHTVETAALAKRRAAARRAQLELPQ